MLSESSSVQLKKLPLLSGNILAQNVDLTEYVLSYSSSCYFMEVKGESMQSLNIHDGDLLVIDRSISAKADDLVVTVENDAFSVMQALPHRSEQYSFFSEPALANETKSNKAIQLWGVVTYVIHHCR